MILKISLFIFSFVLFYVVLFGVEISLFSYHPLFILIALVLITEGIASVQRKKIVTAKARNIHGIFQGIGFFFMVLGVSVIYYNKYLNKKPHFTSIHGQLGLFTFTFMMVQLILGTFITYFPALFGGIAKTKKMYKYHRISGYLLFIILWVTTFYGIQTPFLLIHSNLIYIYSISFTGILFSIFFFSKKKFPLN